MFLEDRNLYYIGGVVRDEILGIKSFDTDYCYEGNAIDYAKVQGLNIIKINSEFGTVRVDADGNSLDIASTRTESYPKKGHLPKVETIGCSLKDDVQRRDFTINSMAKRTTDGELIDYCGGLEDIRKKQIRVLHNRSFIDDPTRIIRGLKFSVRFGFELDAVTKKLQEEYLENINYDMSYHRVKKELTETFNLNNADVFDRFVEQKIYKLLGGNVSKADLKGAGIKKAIDENNIKENIWLIYAAPFINPAETPVPLTRNEKRILEWAEKLKTQKPVNNTPKESIVIARLVENA